jgi:hypothetical protein
MTYYDAGLGSCGDTNNGDSEYVVALAHGLMGLQSNGNPNCGRTITVRYKGKTTKAVAKDKCMGCVSPTPFLQLIHPGYLKVLTLLP